MNHDGEVILKLTCANCDNYNCKIGPQYIPADSLIGCTRWVPEEMFDQYIHYMNEIIPFWHIYDFSYVNNSYNEIYSFLQALYQNFPIEHLTDSKGKIIFSS